MSVEKLVLRLNELNLNASHKGDKIKFSHVGNNVTVTLDEEWKRAIRGYYRSRQLSYEVNDRILWSPKLFERPIGRLNQNMFSRPSYEFTSAKGGKVVFDRASKKFCLAFIESDEYETYFKAIIANRLKRRKNKALDSLGDLVWTPSVIRYEFSTKLEKGDLFDRASKAISACLFKLAYEKGECWEPLKKRNRLRIDFHDESDDEELTIPLAAYDENLVRYYKVARSSQFPSQAFLAFYHILEYNFLRVSDETLYNKIRSQINDTEFKPNQRHIDRLITAIKKHREQSDETEMLRGVLDKYIDEEDLIEFIQMVEKEADEQIYTKKRSIFGEQLFVNLKQGHALSNSAKIVKHIRNALVHSSDRYSREDCHIPLTESEEMVHEFVPLVRFMAEKIIFSSASSSS